MIDTSVNQCCDLEISDHSVSCLFLVFQKDGSIQLVFAKGIWPLGFKQVKKFKKVLYQQKRFIFEIIIYTKDITEKKTK